MLSLPNYLLRQTLLSVFLSQFLAISVYLGSSEVEKERICRWTLKFVISMLPTQFSPQ